MLRRLLALALVAGCASGRPMNTVNVRYIVTDVEQTIRFYTAHLGFEVQAHPAPGFAILARGALRLYVNQPGAGGAGRTVADGRTPAPGGWNRIQIEVADLSEKVEELRREGAVFRGDIIQGNGGRQIVLDDPSGNPIELLEPKRD